MKTGDLVMGGQLDPPPILPIERHFYFKNQKRYVRMKKSKKKFHYFSNNFTLEKYQYQLFCYISRYSLMIGHENPGGQFDPPLYRIGLTPSHLINTFLHEEG